MSERASEPMSQRVAGIADRAQRGRATNAALTHRDRAILRAVAGGRAELLGGSQPDLLVDGRCCCDQPAARRLAHAGLIAGTLPATVGQRVPAQLTPAGRQELLLAG